MNRDGDNSNETAEQVNAPLFLRRHESEPDGAPASGAGAKLAPNVSSAGDAQLQHETDAESHGDEASNSPPRAQQLKGKRKAETSKPAGDPAAAKKGARKSWKKPEVRSACACADTILSRHVLSLSSS